MPLGREQYLLDIHRIFYINSLTKIVFLLQLKGIRAKYLNRHNIGVLSVFIILLSVGCNPTKYIPEDDYLLDKVRIEKKKDKIKPQEIKSYLKQNPNKRIFWVKFHLGLYNLSNPEKDSWLNRWFRRIGEAPVVYDEFATERTTHQLRQLYINKGYYHAQVFDTTRYKKRQKAEVVYSIYPGIPYSIRNISYHIEDTTLVPYIFADTVNSFIRRDDQYDFDNFQAERERMETNLRNNGFYNFAKEFIYFELDSAVGNHQVDIIVGVKGYQITQPDGETVIQSHQRYYIDDITVFPELQDGDELTDEARKAYFDTTYNEGIRFVYTGNNSIKSNILVSSIPLSVDSIYREMNEQNTYKNLSALRMFRYVNIDFLEKDTPDSSGYRPLSGIVTLVPQKKQSYSIAGEFTNSGGNFGLGINFNFQHRNTFKGAEIFTIGFNGSNEWIENPAYADGQARKRYQSYVDFGTEASLSIPKFLLPFPWQKFRMKNNPKTMFSLGYQFQDRPIYKASITNARIGYNWQSSRYLTHIVNPIDVNSVNSDLSQSFIDRNRSNIALLNSFRTHFVAVTNYSLIFNNQLIGTKNLNYTFFRLNLETAGNILTGFNNVFDAPRNDQGKYEVFGMQYAQYAKTDFDLRQSFQVTEENNLVYRLFAGVGYPYKNSDGVPFERQYYAGGANSIRAWRVWSLGPGSYSGNDSLYYQTADIKLETNLEYRFDMFWQLEGAFFLDVGNIWSVVDESIDKRAGAQFKLDKFYRDLAVGSGFGARFDFSFILLRLDLGMKLRDPALEGTNKWIFNNPDFRKDILSLQIGIGYPF